MFRQNLNFKLITHQIKVPPPLHWDQKFISRSIPCHPHPMTRRPTSPRVNYSGYGEFYKRFRTRKGWTRRGRKLVNPLWVLGCSGKLVVAVCLEHLLDTDCDLVVVAEVGWSVGWSVAWTMMQLVIPQFVFMSVQEDFIVRMWPEVQ